MTKTQVLLRVNELISRCGARPLAPDYVMNGALTAMIAIYAENSPQVKMLLKQYDDIGKAPNLPDPARAEARIEALRAILQSAAEDVESGLLTSLEHRVTSDVLSDLVQLAREALHQSSDGATNVAAVLAAAAYEDTIRRIAKEHAGVIGQDKLEAVITKLKDAGLLVPPLLGIVLGHLNFRNRALHAQWDQIERVAVESALALVEQLLLKHFAQGG